MSALEDRIRIGLDADREVPELLDAVHQGARRRQLRRNVSAASAAALAVAMIAAGITLSVGENRTAPPPAPQPTRTEQPNPGPGAQDYPEGIEVAGDDLLVRTATRCRETPPEAPRQCDLSWWRFDGKSWSADQERPDREGFGQWLANGRGAIWPPEGDRPALVTRDGGNTWTETSFPPACLEERNDCQLTATSTALFITDTYVGHPIRLYRADPSLEFWQPVEAPAGADIFTVVGNGIVGVDTPQATRLWVSRDDGNTWSSTSPPCDNVFLHGDNYWSGVVAQCGGSLNPGGVTIHRSSNLTTWQRLGAQSDRPFDVPYPVYLSDEAVIVLNQEVPTLLTPSGSFPVSLSDSTRFEYNVTRVGSTYYALVHQGPIEPWTQQLRRSDDGGRTWTVVTPSVPQPY